MSDALSRRDKELEERLWEASAHLKKDAQSRQDNALETANYQMIIKMLIHWAFTIAGVVVSCVFQKILT